MTVERQKQHDDTDRVRAVADTILYEGYLLYPYRASSRKNHSRWQFGVLGPPGAAASGLGEPPALAAQTVLRILGAEPAIEVAAGQRDLNKIMGVHALPRLPEPADIADAIAFLCSDQAKAITSILLPVDAGFLAAVSYRTYAGGVP